MPTTPLLQLAAKEGIIPQDYYQELSGWTKLRNEVVHTGRRVSRHEAQAVVDGIERIIQRT